MTAEVRFQERGEGSTILCLHGLTSASQAFEHAQDLSDTFRVLAWDAPGFGKSPDPDGQPTLSWYAERAAELVRAQCSEPVHVLGVSWGGLVGMRLALDEPQLVKSLVLADSMLGYAHDQTGAERVAADCDMLSTSGVAAFAAAHVPRLVSPNAEPRLIEALTTMLTSDVRPGGYAAAAATVVDTDLKPALRSVIQPTLVLCGEDDGITGIDMSQRVASAIPNAVFVTMAGAGHLPHQEKPESFNAWLRSFLHIVDNVRETAEV